MLIKILRLCVNVVGLYEIVMIVLIFDWVSMLVCVWVLVCGGLKIIVLKFFSFLEISGCWNRLCFLNVIFFSFCGLCKVWLRVVMVVVLFFNVCMFEIWVRCNVKVLMLVKRFVIFLVLLMFFRMSCDSFVLVVCVVCVNLFGGGMILMLFILSSGG